MDTGVHPYRWRDWRLGTVGAGPCARPGPAAFLFVPFCGNFFVAVSEPFGPK